MSLTTESFCCHKPQKCAVLDSGACPTRRVQCSLHGCGRIESEHHRGQQCNRDWCFEEHGAFTEHWCAVCGREAGQVQIPR
jgi:hypothetical protein